MKFKKIYIIELLVGFLLLLYVGFSDQTNIHVMSVDDVSDYNNDWSIRWDGQELEPDVLPEKIDNPNSATIYLEKEMTEEDNRYDTAIRFYTLHMQVCVYADDELIYSLEKPQGSHCKTPGSGWNIIKLHNDDVGKTLRVELTPAYSDVADTIPSFSKGEETSLYTEIFKSSALSIGLCFVMLLMGLAIVVVLLFFRKKLHLTKYIIWLGLFSIMLSLWSGYETQLFTALWGRNQFFTYLTFISLKLIFLPIMIFIRYLYNTSDNRVMDILCGLSVADFTVTTVLQVLGIADYRETLLPSHILYVLGASWAIYLTVKLLVRGTKEERKKIAFHAGCLLFVAFTVVADAFRFYLFASFDSARFARVGLLVYIIVLAYLVVRDSIALIDVGRRASDIQADARKDGLTDVDNRKAFEEELDGIDETLLEQYALIMFDLNNLKNVNDLFGHNMGDLYIITMSRLIQEIYCTYGTVYRIGGDEFCVVAKNIDRALFEDLSARLEKKIILANEQYIERRMSVACGYATFDATTDVTIRDVLRRADEEMYKEKYRMKKGRVRR